MPLVSKHFSKEELACHHCEEYLIKQELLDALEALRALGPEPIIVTDAYRCEYWNAHVGGVPHSQHPLGEAADIKIIGLTLQEMYDRAIQIPAFKNGGIGVYPDKRTNKDIGFIHVDIREGRARWARKDGVYLDIKTAGLVLENIETKDA